MHANKREELPRAGAGDIIAARAEADHSPATPWPTRRSDHLESMTFPDPVIYWPSTEDEERPGKWAPPIQKLARRPDLPGPTDDETGQTRSSPAWVTAPGDPGRSDARRVQGRGEVGKPQVAYREERSSVWSRKRTTPQEADGGPARYAKCRSGSTARDDLRWPSYEFVTRHRDASARVHPSATPALGANAVRQSWPGTRWWGSS